MSYRILKIDSYFKQYLHDYYVVNRDISSKSYQAQYEHLMGDCFSWSDYFEQGFRKLGIDAYQIVENSVPMQEAWAKEHGFNKTGRAILFEQIKRIKPDIIFLERPEILTENELQYVKKIAPSIKLITAFHCAPLSNGSMGSLQELDFVIACIPGFQEMLHRKGVNTYLVYHAFEKSLTRKFINEPDKDINLLFTGSLFFGPGLHQERIEYMESIIQAGVDMTIFGNLDSWQQQFLKKTVRRLIRFLERTQQTFIIDKVDILNRYREYGQVTLAGYSKKLKKATNPPRFGLDMYQLLNRAKMTFNIHGAIAGNCAGNMRLFEATGMGSLLITDYKGNIGDLFEPGQEIITYKTEEECIEKIKWCLNHPQDLEAIAKAGQKRTLKDHTFEKRSEQLNEIFLQELKKK